MLKINSLFNKTSVLPFHFSSLHFVCIFAPISSCFGFFLFSFGPLFLQCLCLYLLSFFYFLRSPSTQAVLPFPQHTPQTHLRFTTSFDQTHHHKHNLFSSSFEWTHNKPKHSSKFLLQNSLSLYLSIYLILIKNPKIPNLEISRKFTLSFFKFPRISICTI